MSKQPASIAEIQEELVLEPTLDFSPFLLTLHGDTSPQRLADVQRHINAKVASYCEPSWFLSTSMVSPTLSPIAFLKAIGCSSLRGGGVN